VRLTGEIDCWGRNNTGQVGDGTVTCTSLSVSCFDDRALPTRVQSAVAFNSVSSGGRIINGFGGGTSCGITAASIAFCWGQNTNGQIGDDSRTQRLIPVTVSGNHTWRSIHVGSTTVCGVTVNNIGHCWGYNGTGAIGDGTTIDRLVPTPVAGGIPFSRITVGYDHACGLSITGEVYCWGANSNGQLGNGTTTASPSPVRLTFPK
jgi:alpha-tubulin suppressor-like RCC1 family protein